MRRRDRGMALIQALLIVAALAAVATALLLRAERARERLEWRFTADQAGLYLDSGAELLRTSLPRGAVYLAQDWNRPREGLEIDRGRLGWSVTDLRGRFNVNLLLADETGLYRDVFEGLAREVGIPRAEVAATLRGLEDRTAPLGNADILALGFDDGERDKAWDEMLDLVWAWPAEEGMNLNTLPEDTLALLLPGIGRSGLDALRRELEGDPEQSYETLLDWVEDRLGEETRTLLEAMPFSTESPLFMARLTLQLDTLVLRRSVVLDTGGPEGVSAIVMSIPGP